MDKNSIELTKKLTDLDRKIEEIDKLLINARFSLHEFIWELVESNHINNYPKKSQSPGRPILSGG